MLSAPVLTTYSSDSPKTVVVQIAVLQMSAARNQVRTALVTRADENITCPELIIAPPCRMREV
jgi:hypothetical protein